MLIKSFNQGRLPVTNVEVGHNEGELGKSKQESGDIVCWEGAEGKIAWPRQGLVVVPAQIGHDRDGVQPVV